MFPENTLPITLSPYTYVVGLIDELINELLMMWLDSTWAKGPITTLSNNEHVSTNAPSPMML